MTAAAQTRYVLSKDGSVQIAVEMTDDLHALCWGRLGVSTGPYPVPLIEAADPFAWVRAERMIGQLTVSERLAGLRATSGADHRRAA